MHIIKTLAAQALRDKVPLNNINNIMWFKKEIGKQILVGWLRRRLPGLLPI
jgi:hypothetical protein